MSHYCRGTAKGEGKDSAPGGQPLLETPQNLCLNVHRWPLASSWFSIGVNYSGPRNGSMLQIGVQHQHYENGFHFQSSDDGKNQTAEKN